MAVQRVEGVVKHFFLFFFLTIPFFLCNGVDEDDRNKKIDALDFIFRYHFPINIKNMNLF